MNRAAAISRIQEGLGFAVRQETVIISRLKEAQRELERGKTLPKFLLQEDETLVLAIGDSTAPLPARFLRIDDSFVPYFISPDTDLPVYLRVVGSYTDARQANISDEAETPTVMVIREATIDFINPVSAVTTVFWQYYKAATVLDADAENEWLEETQGAPEWLIGEAGYRMAKNLRDKDATADFDDMRKTARASCLAEIIADEEASGPVVMNEDA